MINPEGCSGRVTFPPTNIQGEMIEDDSTGEEALYV